MTKDKSHNPLSLSYIVAGIFITVLGGLILAYIIQDARFAPTHTADTDPIACNWTGTVVGETYPDFSTQIDLFIKADCVLPSPI